MVLKSKKVKCYRIKNYTNSLFCMHFFVAFERRPAGVYGVYQAPTELLCTPQVFTGN